VLVAPPQASYNSLRRELSKAPPRVLALPLLEQLFIALNVFGGFYGFITLTSEQEYPLRETFLPAPSI
jgi:hypothetical protein